MNRVILSFCAALGCTLLTSQSATAHPSIEGGVKQGAFAAKNAEGKGVMGGHIELVADRKAGEVRVYLSQSTDEKTGEKKYHEWVHNLTVRNQTITTPDGRKEVVLLPLPSPGAGAEWFSVAPVKTNGGYQFYWIELTAKLALDGDTANAKPLKFRAGTDPRGRQCLRADLAFGNATSIRIADVSLAVKDPSGKKPAWEKKYFDKTAWGLGQLWKEVATRDLPLDKFSEFIAASGGMDKHRKPEAPAIASR
jgi:hypothetical protein